MSSRHLNPPAASAAGSSSRRLRKIAAAAAGATTTRDWASLHEDLVSLIGWRVLAGDLRDYVRFRAACPHWRSSAASPRGRGVTDPRFHPRRWMLFPEGHGLHPGHVELGGRVRFFNLSTGAFVRAQLPLFSDHCVLDSVDGVLLLQRDHDTAVRLLHPSTGDVAEFPPLETLLPHVEPWLRGNKWGYLRDIRAACISVGGDGVVRVMMSLPGIKNFCFATSGDQQWRISSWWRDTSWCAPLPFQGKIYMLHRPEGSSDEPEVLQVDPPQQEDMTSLPPPKLIAKCPARTEFAPPLYDLVECNSEILVIASRLVEDQEQDSVYRDSAYRLQYSVYRLADLMQERTVPLGCIGGSTLFLSRWRSLHVSSEAFPTIVADTIVVFHPGKICLAQYHLKSGTLSAASDGCTSGIAFLSPCSIIYHIFTCCFRKHWNKGQIIHQGNWKQWRVKRKWRKGA